MAQMDDLYAALKAAHDAGDTAGATKLATYIQNMSTAAQSKANSDAQDQRIKDDLTGDMGPVGKFVAGYGSAVPRLVRGIGQRLGINSQADVDEANKLDAPLLATKAGSIGNIGGNIGAAVPTAFVPGANTLAGAAVIGSGLGLAQPTSSDDNGTLLGVNVGAPVKNALIGGAAGMGGVVAGRALGAAYQGGKALLEPFTEAGRDRIGGRMIQRFADDPSKIAATTNAPTVTGALPTLAEQTGDAGLARLQDSLRAADPQISNRIGNRLSDNNAARVNALRTLAGEDGARDFAAANRSGTAEQLYDQAFQNNAALSPSQLKAQSDLLGGSKIQALLETPAIADARQAAKTIAANRGAAIDDPAGSVQGLHYMKLAMDDAISKAKAAGTATGDNLAASIKSAQGRLVSALETLSPDYKAARTTYAQMSQPVNSMDTAALLARKGLSNGSDLSGTPTINRNALLGALRDEPALVKQATGRNLGGLDKVMEPKDLDMLRAIASEADRTGAVASAGNGPGSATAQRMASQNILSQVIGPTGLPQSWAESVLARTVAGKPLNLIYGGVAEPKIQQALAEAVLDPMKAKAMLAAAAPAQRPAILQLLQRTAAARTAPTANALANRP